MSKRSSRAIPETVRVAFISGLLLTVAGCSSEVSRLSQPFFSNGDTTGSLVPPEPVYGVGLAANSSPRDNSGYQPVSRGSITSAPLAAAPGAGVSNGPISTRSTQPLQQAAYNPSAQPISSAQPAYSPQPSYAQQRGYGEQQLQPRRLPAPQAQLTQPRREANGQTHKVASGDTVYSIARNYDVPVSEIIAENNLDQPDDIRVGQRLTIPGANYAAADRPVRVATSEHIQNDATPAPIARPVQQGFTLQPRRAPADQQVGNTPPRRVATTPVQGRPLDYGSSTATPQPPKTDGERTALLAPSRLPVRQPQQSNDLPEPDSLSGGKFRWPARGRIIGQFGSKPNGVQNDGINIAVPEGTSVKAAEAGVVAYVGNELKGYGNLILIRHAEDWVTAYAHNSEVLVRRGDTVQRGQIVAKAGRTGNVDQPQLHFEIRKGSKPQDPMQQLPST